MEKKTFHKNLNHCTSLVLDTTDYRALDFVPVAGDKTRSHDVSSRQMPYALLAVKLQLETF